MKGIVGTRHSDQSGPPPADGDRPLLWVACPTNRSGKSEFTSFFIVQKPEGMGAMKIDLFPHGNPKASLSSA